MSNPMAEPCAHDRLVRPEFPIGGLAIGVIVMLGIGLPGLVAQPSTRTAIIFGVFLVPVLVMVWLALRRVEIIRRADAGVLRIVRHRPPFASTVREIARRSIVSVRIGQNQRARSVVIVLDDGEELWLPGVPTAAHSVEDVAAFVRAWESPLPSLPGVCRPAHLTPRPSLSPALRVARTLAATRRRHPAATRRHPWNA